MDGKVRRLFERLIRNTPYLIQRIFFTGRNNREFKAWMKSGKNLPLPRKIKESTIEKYRSATGYDTLVETGTYLGDMVFAQLKNFKTIYSIELDSQLYKNAVHRFRSFHHVRILQGDSGKVLVKLMNELKSPAIFWLDGHYSAGVTALGEKVTPIFEELRSIFSTKLNHGILIDDARLFTGRDGYPSFEDLKEFVHQYLPGQKIEVSDDCIQILINK